MIVEMSGEQLASPIHVIETRGTRLEIEEASSSGLELYEKQHNELGSKVRAGRLQNEGCKTSDGVIFVCHFFAERVDDTRKKDWTGFVYIW